MKQLIFLYLLCLSYTALCQKIYVKNYFSNGQIKEEGWLVKNKKTDYWRFYYKNGNLQKEGQFSNNLETDYWYFYTQEEKKEKEGHFYRGIKTDWWLFYDKRGIVDYKCQLKNNKKNGYCLVYKNKKLVKASKFKNDKKLKEWSDYWSFRRENNLSDLK